MNELHLLRLPIRTRRFTEWALRKGYLKTPHGDGKGKPREADPGYALHAMTTGLFGAGEAPRPFCPPPLGQRERRPGAEAEARMEIWGYARRPAGELAELAKLADEELLGAVDRKGFRSKPMPAAWPEGLRLRFELRACPVKRRLAKRRLETRRGDRMETTVFDNPRGREMDAYQLAAARAAESGAQPPSREEAYIRWLAERFAPAAGSGAPPAAALAGDGNDRADVRVDSWRSTRLLRMDRGRRPHWLARPDVRFSGVLRIADPQAFPRLLESGVGRHCGFGFGMLLLRPA